MKQEKLEDLTRSLDTTLISRRQLLNGLAASAIVVALPILDLGRRNLSYAQTASQVTASSSVTGNVLEDAKACATPGQRSSEPKMRGVLSHGTLMLKSL